MADTQENIKMKSRFLRARFIRARFLRARFLRARFLRARFLSFTNYTPHSSVKRKCGAFLHTPGGNNLIPEIKLSEANSPKSKLVKKDLFKSPSPSDEIYFSDDPVDDTEVKINIQSNMDFQSQILQVTPQNCQIYLRF